MSTEQYCRYFELLVCVNTCPQHQFDDCDTCAHVKQNKDVGQRLQHRGKQGNSVWSCVKARCWVFGLVFNFLISMWFLTFPENTYKVLIGFALTTTKAVASIIEARFRIRKITNERHCYTVWHRERVSERP